MVEEFRKKLKKLVIVHANYELLSMYDSQKSTQGLCLTTKSSLVYYEVSSMRLFLKSIEFMMSDFPR